MGSGGVTNFLEGGLEGRINTSERLEPPSYYATVALDPPDTAFTERISKTKTPFKSGKKPYGLSRGLRCLSSKMKRSMRLYLRQRKPLFPLIVTPVISKVFRMRFRLNMVCPLKSARKKIRFLVECDVIESSGPEAGFRKIRQVKKTEFPEHGLPHARSGKVKFTFYSG
jgi:hypothetical protein